MTVFNRALAYVGKYPPAVAGQDGHAHTIKLARTLLSGFALDQSEVLSCMMAWNLACQPPWAEGELHHKIRSVVSTPSPHPPGWMLDDFSPSANTGAVPARASFDPDSLERMAGGLKITPRWLASRSPADVAVDAVGFLQLAFGEGEKAIVFDDQRSQGQAVFPDDTIPTSGADGIWFLIQPVDGLTHYNPRTQRPSRRSEESVKGWRHLLLESDSAPSGLWLAAICQLPLPIVSICHSGNRSLHVIVRIDAESKLEWDAAVASVRDELAVLGTDPKAMTAIRLARLPGCYRANKGRWQSLYYLDPTPDGRPIIERKPS